jgi:hypothetical protein
LASSRPLALPGDRFSGRFSASDAPVAGARPLAVRVALTPFVFCVPVAEAMSSELAGTSWRLVNVTSMDDRVGVQKELSN